MAGMTVEDALAYLKTISTSTGDDAFTHISEIVRTVSTFATFYATPNDADLRNILSSFFFCRNFTCLQRFSVNYQIMHHGSQDFCVVMLNLEFGCVQVLQAKAKNAVDILESSFLLKKTRFVSHEGDKPVKRGRDPSDVKPVKQFFSLFWYSVGIHFRQST